MAFPLSTFANLIIRDHAKKIEKVGKYRSYILNNWDRMVDWRACLKNPPEDARSLGAMESNQRHITYRMKKRGMHWSLEGAEAMVKVKQGILKKQGSIAVYGPHSSAIGKLAKSFR